MHVAVGSRQLRIGTLERVLYPHTGTTRAALFDYYTRVASVMVPHLRERLLHMHRYPEGVEGPRFWQKECPDHKPEGVPTGGVYSRDKGQGICYCVLNELAAVMGAGNRGSLWLHTPLHTRQDLHRPTVLAFYLAPSRRMDVLACAEVALRLRDVLSGIGMEAWVKTSGSKGLQVYAPLREPRTYAQTKPLARAIAEGIEE